MTGLVMPTHYWAPEYYKTFGPEVADLCAEAHYIPDPEQRLALDIIFALRSDGLSAAFEILMKCGRQNIKCLATDTPVLTDRGWQPIADVKAGDLVFHPSGHMVPVIAASTVKTGRDCYRVTTTDGRSVVTDGEHLWAVDDRQVSSTRRHLREHRLLTTRQIAEMGVLRGGRKRNVTTGGVRYQTGEYRFQLPRQQALKSPSTDLPADPYILGAWLGDGTSKAAELHCSEEDAAYWAGQIGAAGYQARVRDGHSCPVISIGGLAAALSELGVLRNKHVPDLYLTAGTRQREALLQGLLDTDGTVNHRSGQVLFCNTRRQLSEAVVYLARSLGWRAVLKQRRARLNGRDAGPVYWATFTPRRGDGFAPFRLPRKQAQVRPGLASAGRFTVSIKSVEPAASVPVCCIKTASPDGLFLAGRDLVATHNTGTELQACIGWTMISEVRLVVYSAHNFTTAMETFRTAVEIFTGADILRRHVKKIVRNHGEESIEITPDPKRRITRTSRILFKTRTAGGGRGLSGNKVVLDEAMFLKAVHMGALLPTMSAQPDPQVLYGSSAGMAESEVLRETTERGRSASEGKDERLAMLEWCAPPPAQVCEAGDRCTHSKTSVGCGCDKPDFWVYANPSLGKKRANGTGLTFEYVKAERRAMPVSEFMRERMGWDDTPTEGTSPIPMTTWVQTADKTSRVAAGSALAIGIDVAPDSSSSAIGVAGWRGDDLPHVEVVEHLPGTSWLVDRVVGIVERRDPVALVMDPAAMAGAVERQLRNRGLVVLAEDKPVPHGQHRLVLVPARMMAQACTSFANHAANLTLRHPDQEPLNLAVKGGRSRPVSQAWAWSPAPGADITPLVACTLALAGLEAFGKKPGPSQPFALF